MENKEEKGERNDQKEAPNISLNIQPEGPKTNWKLVNVPPGFYIDLHGLTSSMWDITHSKYSGRTWLNSHP